MNSNSNTLYQLAAAGLIRAIGEVTTTKSSPLCHKELAEFLARMDDILVALTVIRSDWRRAEESSTDTPSNPETESIS